MTTYTLDGTLWLCESCGCATSYRPAVGDVCHACLRVIAEVKP